MVRLIWPFCGLVLASASNDYLMSFFPTFLFTFLARAPLPQRAESRRREALSAGTFSALVAATPCLEQSLLRV